MSRGYNTDGMLTFPETESPIINCLESIECTIAFWVGDWSEDRRLAWIYGIVFGWNYGDAEEILQKRFGWDNNDIERMHQYHKEWLKLKNMKDTEKIIDEIKTRIVHAIDDMEKTHDFSAKWGLEIAMRHIDDVMKEAET